MNMTLTPKQLISTLPFLHKAGLVPYIMSAPGLGKSSIFRQYSDSITFDHVDTRLAYNSPTDVRGILHIVDGEVRCAVPTEYPTKAVVWTLEELPSAPRAVQIAALQLLLERQIGAYKVPDGTFLCATGNRPIDKAHVEKMSSAVINRIVQITLTPSVPDWIEWALGAGVDPRVIAFLQFRPSLLSDFDGSKWDGHSAFASPRSWEFVSKLISVMGVKVHEHTPVLVNGMVGTAAAIEFMGFLNVFGKIPAIEEIQLDPLGAAVPTKPDERYAITAAIMAQIDKGNFGRFIQYLERMPKDFEIFAVKCALKRCKEITQASAFKTWFIKNQSFLAE